MAGQRQTIRHDLREVTGGAPRQLEFLREEPLAIHIEDRAYAVLLRTPGQEEALAAGFCLAEGVIDSPADIRQIGYDEIHDANAVHVWLTAECATRSKDILKRRGFVSRSSCGVCGKELVEDLVQRVQTVPDDVRLSPGRAQALLDSLERHQRLYETTRCAHAALVYDRRGELLGLAEDVGRHNALDKAVGQTLLDGRLEQAAIAVLSSRDSYELVQKAARAGIQVVLSYSRPTALALELAQRVGMSLVFRSEQQLLVACGEHRLRGE